jgi:hypothetical protein
MIQFLIDGNGVYRDRAFELNFVILQRRLHVSHCGILGIGPVSIDEFVRRLAIGGRIYPYLLFGIL